MADPKKQKEKEKVESVEDTSAHTTEDPKQNQDPAYVFAQYLVFLEAMKKVKKSIDYAPTNTPKNFYDQFQFYDDGVDYRLYLFVNGTWRYVALT